MRGQVGKEFHASDALARLVLVALLDDPWRWWTVAKMADALRRSRNAVGSRIDSLHRGGIIEQLPFTPRARGRRSEMYWVGPNGLRAARMMLRGHYWTLHKMASPLNLSVYKALGFGEMREACQCRCGRCCCGLPALVHEPE